MQRSIHFVDLGSGSHRKMPVVVCQSDNAGATVVLTANVHGDEVTGVMALHALIAWLTENMQQGTVVLYPTLNPDGMVEGSRALPRIGVDLNRSFPGGTRRKGERIAAAIWRDIRSRDLDLLIDLHADSALSIPYAIVDRPVRLSDTERTALSARLLQTAAATGLTVLREYPNEQYVQYSLDKSLAGAVVNRLGAVAVTIEAGPRRYADPGSVAVMFDAVLRVLAHVGVVDWTADAAPSAVRGIWRRAAAPKARLGGLFTPLFAPGECFEAGGLLGLIRDVTGEVVDRVIAESPGLAVSWSETSWVNGGAVVGTIGVPDEEPL